MASNGVASTRIDDRRVEDARSMTTRLVARVDADVDAAMTVARAVRDGGIVMLMLTLRSRL